MGLVEYLNSLTEVLEVGLLKYKIQNKAAERYMSSNPIWKLLRWYWICHRTALVVYTHTHTYGFEMRVIYWKILRKLKRWSKFWNWSLCFLPFKFKLLAFKEYNSEIVYIKISKFQLQEFSWNHLFHGKPWHASWTCKLVAFF